MALSLSKEEIFIRPAKWSDLGPTATISMVTYFHIPAVHYTFPHRYHYVLDVHRFFFQRDVGRFYDPRNISLVAVSRSEPNIPLGFAHFIRLGSDAAARAQIYEKQTVSLRFKAWFWWAWFGIYNFIRPFRCWDRANSLQYWAGQAADDSKHWGAKDRQNRWHVQSLVVRQDCQGMGIGSRLMDVVMRKAREENVVIGVEATPVGVPIYTKFGFRKLADYTLKLEEGGGVFIWEPAKEE